MNTNRTAGAIACVAAAAAIAACGQMARDVTAPGSAPRLASAAAASNAAVVMRGIACDIGPGKGKPIPGTSLTFELVIGTAHQTQSASGNYTVTCTAEMAAGDERPQQAVVMQTGPDQAYNCFILDSDGVHIIQGTSGHQVWTPSGNIIAKCTYKPKKA